MKPEIFLLIGGPSLLLLTVVLSAYSIGVSMNSRKFCMNVVVLTGYLAAVVWVLFCYIFDLPFGTVSGPEAIPHFFKIFAFYGALVPFTLAFVSLIFMIAFSAASKRLRRKKEPHRQA